MTEPGWAVVIELPEGSISPGRADPCSRGGGRSSDRLYSASDNMSAKAVSPGPGDGPALQGPRAERGLFTPLGRGASLGESTACHGVPPAVVPTCPAQGSWIVTKAPAWRAGASSSSTSRNYRLGLFGYQPNPGVAPANLGLMDQIAALKWV